MISGDAEVKIEKIEKIDCPGNFDRGTKVQDEFTTTNKTNMGKTKWTRCCIGEYRGD